MNNFTGFRTFEVDDQIINTLYEKSKVEIWDKRHSIYPNLYIELRSTQDNKHTALGRIDKTGTYIEKIPETSLSNIKPRNREQVFTIDALMNPEVTVVVLTGSAGVGKTILALGCALEQMDKGRFKKVILTRPMSEVGKYRLGTLPGNAQEKFGPYLTNYLSNLEHFVGNRYAVNDLLDQGGFEIVPLQLMRGASFNDCLVLADECQVCSFQEVLTIGTRIGYNSKLVIMGDLNQRDEKIARDKTGLYKLTNDKIAKESPLVAAIELQRCERSITARFFSKLFEE